MIFITKHSMSEFCLASMLFSIALLCSCQTTISDPREEFVRSLKGANVEGYYFAIEENETQIVTSLTNSAVRNLIQLDGDTTVVLKYTRIKEKKANTAKIYITEVVKTGTALALLVKDIEKGEVSSRKTFPAPVPHNDTDTTGSLPIFDSLEDCLTNFNCTRRGALQCEANRTCEDQYAAMICCLSDGLCYSVHLIIRPTTLRCKVAVPIPNFEGFVFKQQ